MFGDPPPPAHPFASRSSCKASLELLTEKLQIGIAQSFPDRAQALPKLIGVIAPEPVP